MPTTLSKPQSPNELRNSLNDQLKKSIPADQSDTLSERIKDFDEFENSTPDIEMVDVVTIDVTQLDDNDVTPLDTISKSQLSESSHDAADFKKKMKSYLEEFMNSTKPKKSKK